MPARVKAKFIPPMLLLKTERLPDDDARIHELKLDGYRAIAFKARARFTFGRAMTRTSRCGIPPW
jgi:ATP-dependent DNA ligase